MTFSQFLTDEFFRQYVGLDDYAPEAESDWLAELEPYDWIELAEKWHNSFNKEKIGYNLCKKCNKIWQVYIEKDEEKYCPSCNEKLTTKGE